MRTEETAAALRRLDALAVSEFRDNAAIYEDEERAPLETLRKIHEIGLLHATPSRRHGGLDGSLLGDDPGLFVTALRTLCHGDAAAGHCYQLHNHAAWLIDALGTPRQIEEVLRPLTARFGLLAFVGSEPGRASNRDPMQTRARRVDGGWLVNGVKNFVTNGTIADLIVVSVGVDGVPETADPSQRHLSIMVEHDAEGVTWDDSWYRPNGMRSARSPLLKLEDVFIPDARVVGEEPGVMPRGRWHGRFHLGFAANYLGSAEGLCGWYLEYTRTRGRTKDPIVQLRTGEMRLKLDAASALFEAAILSWQNRPVVEAELISMSAKVNAAKAAFEISHIVLHAAGAQAQFEDKPLGRFLRNLEMHVVHTGHDRTAQILGQAALGEPFDSTLLR